MRLKYRVELAGCLDQPCPCKKFITASTSTTGYRIVPQQVSGQAFIPSAKLYPQYEKECSRWALSFFTSLSKAQKKLRSLKERVPLVLGTMGDHISAVALDPADGLFSAPNNKGHFEVHEADSANLATKAAAPTPGLVSSSIVATPSTLQANVAKMLGTESK